MTDTERGAEPEALLAGLPKATPGRKLGGILILRHRDGEMLGRMARRWVRVAHGLGIKVLVAGDAALALRSGADGVHLPEALLRRRPGLARTRPRPGWVVTASAHGPAALMLAERAGVDAVLLSPVMATPSHPAAAPIGPLRFTLLCRRVRTAVFALGGIDISNLRRLKGSGCGGVAGIGLFTAP